MNVLVACEFSGIVREAFNHEGHNATSCDLLPSQQRGSHIMGDVLKEIEKHGDCYDLMIAHPPCTHLSSSGAAWFEQKRKDGRQQQAIDFFMKLTEAPIPR